MAEQWLSIVEYARASGISDMTIRRRIRTGKIKAELKDGKYFIPVDMQNHSKQSQASAPQRPAASHALVKNSRSMDSHSEPAPARSQDYSGLTLTEKIMPVIMRADNTHQINHGVQPNQIPNWLTNNGQSSQQNFHASNHQPKLTAVPENLSRPLIEMGQASIEARSLLEFCDQALDQARSTVMAVESKYSARIEALNAQLHQRDQEIRSLNQQIEDLQLLVQILERKKIG